MIADNPSHRGAKPVVHALGLVALAALLAGCDRPQITTYRVPKEKPADQPSHGPHDAAAMPPRIRPQLEWKLPEGWKQVESRIGLATFSITGRDGAEAQVNVTPLPPMGGREALIINMWRTQVGLGEISEAEAMKQMTDVQVGTEPGRMFDIANKPADGAAAQRIVTAMVHRPDGSWFYKLAGDDALVQAEKPRFIEFLKSIRIKETPPGESTSPAAVAAAPPAPSRFKWKVPDGWKPVAAGQMQAARFTVPAADAAKAEVTVSIFPSDTGGQLGNINRWRGQIGLEPVDAAGLAKLVTPLDSQNPQAILVEMTNAGRRMIGAIVPRSGQWFFYKLLGDDAAVAPQKDAFVEFVKSEP